MCLISFVYFRPFTNRTCSFYRIRLLLNPCLPPRAGSPSYISYCSCLEWHAAKLQITDQITEIFSCFRAKFLLLARTRTRACTRKYSVHAYFRKQVKARKHVLLHLLFGIVYNISIIKWKPKTQVYLFPCMLFLIERF